MPSLAESLRAFRARSHPRHAKAPYGQSQFRHGQSPDSNCRCEQSGSRWLQEGRNQSIEPISKAPCSFHMKMKGGIGTIRAHPARIFRFAFLQALSPWHLAFATSLQNRTLQNLNLQASAHVARQLSCFWQAASTASIGSPGPLLDQPHQERQDRRAGRAQRGARPGGQEQGSAGQSRGARSVPGSTGASRLRGRA